MSPCSPAAAPTRRRRATGATPAPRCGTTEATRCSCSTQSATSRRPAATDCGSGADRQGVVDAADRIGDVVGGALGGATAAPEHRRPTTGVEGSGQQPAEKPGILGELEHQSVALG